MTDDGPASRREFVAFVLLAFAFSWGVWVPVALAARAGDPLAPRAVAQLAGAFGPSLAAVALVTYAGGPAGLVDLLRGLTRWRVPARWYAVALLLPPALALAGVGLSILFGTQFPDFSRPPVLELYPLPEEAGAVGPLVLLPAVFLQNALLGSSMGEELGWRGYALPRLQTERSALGSSLLLGLVWAAWHLPLGLFPGGLVPGGPGWGGSLPAFLLGIVADAVLFTWMYNGTGGSLLLALLFHASIATSGLFIPAASVHPLVVPALTWLGVLVVVRTYGPETLARGDRVTVGG